MATGKISAMGYVALRTAQFDAAVRSAADVLGLHPVELSGSKAYMSAARTHHELIYMKDDESSVDHFGVVAASRDDLAAIREKVRDGGWQVISEHPIEDHIEEGFAFVGPEGYTWHVYFGISILFDPAGSLAPDRYGHINFFVDDSIAMRDFLVNVFEFEVSDQIGDDGAFFLRCNAEHHGVAIVKRFGNLSLGLHHHAWQMQDIAHMGRLADRLSQQGSKLLWGPSRHGAGKNIASYYVEPTGNVVELYSNMEYIYDPNRGVLRWEIGDLDATNLWGTTLVDFSASKALPPFRR